MHSRHPMSSPGWKQREQALLVITTRQEWGETPWEAASMRVGVRPPGARPAVPSRSPLPLCPAPFCFTEEAREHRGAGPAATGTCSWGEDSLITSPWTKSHGDRRAGGARRTEETRPWRAHRAPCPKCAGEADNEEKSSFQGRADSSAEGDNGFRLGRQADSRSFLIKLSR